MKKILITLIIIILLPILFVNAVILIDSVVNPNKIPSFFGWKPFIVLSDSMETEIYTGDLIIVKEINTDELKENDIIAFKSGDFVITHRIVQITTEEGQISYITKGDNSNEKDSEVVYPQNVEGIFKFKISNLGNLAMFLQTPLGMISCLSVPFILLVIINIKESSEDKKYLKENANKQKELEEELKELKKKNS